MEKSERLAWRTKPRTYCSCFSTMGDPSNRKFQKKTFQSLKSCFLIFPSRHPWEQAVSLSGAFPAAQSVVAMGDPSNWQIKEKLFRAWKVVFWFSLPDTLQSRQWACQVLFQLPKAQLQWETLPTGKFRKKLFRAWKVVFWFSPPENFQGSGKLCHRPTPVTCLNPLGPTKTERTPNLDGTRRGNKFRI